MSSRHSRRDGQFDDRSRSPRGRLENKKANVFIDNFAAEVLEGDDEILKKLKEVFPGVDVSLHKTITFSGDTRSQADSMMYLFRYLINEKNTNCIRYLVLTLSCISE